MLSCGRRPTAHPCASQAGVTLTGLIVGLAVGSIVLAGTMGVYLMIVRASRDNLQVARLDQELRAALEIMSKDIRRAGAWDFLDTNHDGDANGDGSFTWRDFGIDPGGLGKLDSDQDGDTDDDDLQPTSNPFQRRYGRINLDLCVDTDSSTGACASASCTETNSAGDCIAEIQSGDCLTLAYDIDLDGLVGIRACAKDAGSSACPAPSGAGPSAPIDGSGKAPFAWTAWYPPGGTAAKDIEMEMLGYRLRSGAIEMRVGRSDNGDVEFGCWSAGRWEDMTSSEILVTNLTFDLRSRVQNVSAGASLTDTCASGDLCRTLRSVAISVAARLANDPSVELQLATEVAVRNDRYFEMP